MTKAAHCFGNLEFDSFLNIWEKEYVVPYPLLDWFLERDMYLQAEAVRWCLNRGTNLNHYLHNNLKGGVYPIRWYNNQYYWLVACTNLFKRDSDWIDINKFGLDSSIHPNIKSAFVALLDGYKYDNRGSA